MARGDKNYDKVVRSVNKGQSSEKKIGAIHKMVEALIAGDSKAAAEEFRTYLQIQTRELILGEEAEEELEEAKKDDDDDDDDGDKKKKPDDDGDGVPDWADKKPGKDDKKKDDDDDDDDKKVDESYLTDKPHSSNDTRATKQKFLPDTGDKGVKGDSLKSKPKTSNDTRSSKSKKLADQKEKSPGKLDLSDHKKGDIANRP